MALTIGKSMRITMVICAFLVSVCAAQVDALVPAMTNGQKVQYLSRVLDSLKHPASYELATKGYLSNQIQNERDWVDERIEQHEEDKCHTCNPKATSFWQNVQCVAISSATVAFMIFVFTRVD